MSRNTREPGTVELIAAIVARMPPMTGAACLTARGQFIEAEYGNRTRIRQCISICRSCSVLSACAEWADRQIARDLTGVWAGHFRGTIRRDDHETRSEAK